ncbi:MAG: hypothetical protein ACYTEZ_13545 [Planctomycetota bacterium]|jgi:hypothetical protein
MRERGIGNLPFIGVIVLFVIALALWLMAKSEADDFKARLGDKNKQLLEQDAQLTSAGVAYDALVTVTGFKWPEIQRTDLTYPDPDRLKDKFRTELMKIVEDVRKKSEFELQNRTYTINDQTKEVRVTKGDVNRIQMYGISHVKETVTVQSILDPLGAQFRWAADAIQTNNRMFEEANTTYLKRVADNQSKNNEIQSKYDADVASKGQQFDTQKTRADDLLDQVNTLSASNDSLQTNLATAKAEAQRDKRLLERDKQAWMNRAIAEKQKNEVALAEDPKDGEVLYAAPRRGLVFINRGRRNKLPNGTRFTVWRKGKGDVRQDIALVRVIQVDRTKSTARILKWINPRVPVAEGMNISNPFYDPNRQLKVYIYGDLRQYPTEVAKRRLAESNVVVARRLDDTVNVIVLGEPPVTVAEDIEDEAEAAMAERRASLERDRRLNDILDRARAIGAVVVTEDVLRTFIEY